MSNISWHTNSFVPDYFTQGNVKYERRFIDVETMNDGVQQIPLSFDTTYFGILYEKNNIVVHCNDECSAGSFFVPFLPCQTKEELILRISKFASALGEGMKVPFPYIRVFVYRYVNPNGDRFFAIGGTNLMPKHKIIHELNIKTTLNNPIAPSSKESWDSLIAELENDPKEIFCCQVEKDELLGFESRNVFIPKESKDALIMLPKRGDFIAQHVSLSEEYSPKKAAKTPYGLPINDGKKFKLNKIRFASEEELNQCLQWIIESFRKLTGASCVFAQVFYYTNDGGAIDASIICSRPVKTVNEEDEEETAF